MHQANRSEYKTDINIYMCLLAFEGKNQLGVNRKKKIVAYIRLDSKRTFLSEGHLEPNTP